MIFQHTFSKVEDGTKTVTRRLWLPEWNLGAGRLTTGHGWRRELYRVGGTYGAQPGRGKRAPFRIEILSLREELLQDITWLDAIAEGIPDPRRSAQRLDSVTGPVAQYRNLWDSIHRSHGARWEDNPRVLRIEFKKLEVLNV